MSVIRAEGTRGRYRGRCYPVKLVFVPTCPNKLTAVSGAEYICEAIAQKKLLPIHGLSRSNQPFSDQKGPRPVGELDGACVSAESPVPAIELRGKHV